MDTSKATEALVVGRYSKNVSTRLDALDAVAPLIYNKRNTDIKDDQKSISSPEELEPEYFSDRAEIERRGQQLAFDYTLTQKSSQSERQARHLLEIARHNDEIVFYSENPGLEGYHGQIHPRFSGDHFLTNLDLIDRTVLFKVAQRMPKGAHLHVHFNSTLLPNALLDIAEKMEQMYISSDKPLTSVENLNTCEVQFLMKAPEVVKGDRLVHINENDSTDAHLLRLLTVSTYDLTWKEWLVSKLVFDDQEVHNSGQTSEGAWEKFNGRTRMMKGLFNYETAFTQYTTECLKEFDEDGIQYAEIRPNFMTTNQIWTDDGTRQLDNKQTMQKIVDQFQKYKSDNKNSKICGLKVIYCTPRSFAADKVQAALDECLKFVVEDGFKDYIAGFDLVGEEAQGKPLKAFIPQFQDFKRKCQQLGVTIPFLFHCGETLELGGDTDGNLVDALLLDSKRIGHGFALARKPYLISEFKKRNICLEVCPISNQVLGLTPRMNGHAIYDLLANDVHCTVNSDNGTLFKSTLSHDFYEVMAGSKAMNLHGWRQLVEWSIDHASLTPQELARLRSVWEPLWNDFIEQINKSLEGIQAIEQPAKREERPEVLQRFASQVKSWEARATDIQDSWSSAFKR
ncbi:hypothetical protein BKA67DRAFT_524120 [Truncatella angustata]|uniref:adenosine deaminase n=1 Tax=Truncatella angustata TaxID=152316 RepID=A0A9P8RKV3_9PEZI|nr:uncharacterized protein BKA67DRAFT_524120 [Truncatella angustata]KAH6647915.1 hypothetical protein BKA67DRAFT_524120 [Truncatella angustata]